MEELELLLQSEDMLIFGTIFLVLAVLLIVLKKVPRTQGKNVVGHVIFMVISGLSLYFCPEFIQNALFSQMGVVVLGVVVPITQSIKAVVSIDDVDDVAWLQYWIVSGIFTYCTEWMDIVAENYPTVAEHWYEFEFFAILWLLLPNTDGSAFLFTKVTEPLFAPMARSIKRHVESQLSIFMLIINSGYLWMLWFTFLAFDEEARRFIVIAVGTLYPIAASTIACTSKNVKRDDTFWLTYWICFSILFLAMDYLENFVGSIRGFYSICLCATIYLFLPMFKGADAVFRNIIVPLSGQYEQLFLKDIHLIKIEMEKKITKPKAIESAFEKAAALFVKQK